ncbi:GerAB/ArcD/ProY family transporter [Scopulibacillus cellulosilyticus]|uniref:Endospore germination permease n=1 Tax=Scopulibacillus cellulosilyticus TaxID=2665665 RepID=A0ABW2PYU8_9BACL
MLEKGKISSLQLGILLFELQTATGVISLPSSAYKYAKQNLWISYIFASFVFFIFIFVYFYLNKYYPKKTLIEYCTSLLGKWIGKTIGFICLFYIFYVSTFNLGEYSEFLTINFFSRTPKVVTICGLVIVCCFAVIGGIEVIGRCAQFFLPVIIILFLLMLILILPEAKVLNLFPVLENGFNTPLKGGIISSAWFGDNFILTFLLPYVSDSKKAKKSVMISLLISTLTLTTVSLTILMVLGELTDKFFYPFIVVARYISVADFLEHVEAAVMAIWILGMFIKMTLFIYVLTLGTSQWLKLNDYRPLVLPIGFLLTFLEVWVDPNLATLFKNYNPDHIFGMFPKYIFPAFLFIIALIRHKFISNRKTKDHLA